MKQQSILAYRRFCCGVVYMNEYDYNKHRRQKHRDDSIYELKVRRKRK